MEVRGSNPRTPTIKPLLDRYFLADLARGFSAFETRGGLVGVYRNSLTSPRGEGAEFLDEYATRRGTAQTGTVKLQDLGEHASIAFGGHSAGVTGLGTLDEFVDLVNDLSDQRSAFTA